MKKRVLLTGAAGAVGQEVLKELVKRIDEIEIVVLSKDTKKHRKLLKPYSDIITIIQGDIRDKSSTDKLASKIDFVIHLAAVIPPLAEDQPKLAEEVNVLGTTNLIKSLEEKSPNAFFLFTSTIATYGDRIDNPSIYVTDKLNPSLGDNYGAAKVKAEKQLINSKLNWSIFRLSAIMHFKQKFDPLMFNMPLASSIEICTTRDTAYAIAHSIDYEIELSKKIFNLGGGEKCRVIYRSFLETSLKNSGLGKNAFPENSFATGNFHCGFFEDSNELNEIINFQRDCLEDYYRLFKQELGPLKILTARIFRPFVNYYFLRKSAPLKALKNNDKELIARFYPK